MDAVVGFGRALRGDHGVGARVIDYLRGCVPSGVALIDAGGSTRGLLEALLTYDRVIIVDEIWGDSLPGTAHRLTLEQHASCESPARLCRDLGVSETVRIARAIGKVADIVIFGVEPDRDGQYSATSQRHHSAVRSVAELALEALEERHQIAAA